MRSHMILNSTETDENLRMRKTSTNKKKSSCNNLEADFHLGYELRENPKKTWRISGSANDITRKREVCKECGKEFQSQKALFGHMKCHTDRYSHGLVEENSSSVGDGAQKLVDNLSKNEGDDARTRRRRSRRTRYGSSPSFSATHAAASVSEIEQEEEDVAMCLMLLSRDVGSWGGINPVVTESSGNDAIVFEIRSSFIEKKTAGKDGDLVCKMKKPIEEKEEFDDSDTDSGYYNRSWSDCGLLMNGTKKTELDALDDRFIRYDEFKKPKIGRSSTESAGGETGYEVSDVKLGKDSRMKEEHGCSSIEFSKTPTRRVAAELGTDSSEECTINQVDSKFGRYISNKRTRYIACDAEIGSESLNKMSYDASDNELGKDHYKKSRFQCTACNKSFQSYQALGGHRASHKKVKGCFASRIESGDNSVETDSSPDPATDDKLKPFRIENLSGRGTGELRHGLKRKKAYECPICLKVFASGQALGGHKRSHLVGNSESRANACQTVIIQKQVPEIPELLDLNLPAPIDEQTYSHVDFNPWLAGSDHKYKPLMGLISS